MPDRKFEVKLTLLMDPEDEQALREKAADDCNVEGADDTNTEGEYTMPLADVVLAVVEGQVWSNVQFDGLPLKCDEEGDPKGTITEV